MFDIRVMLNSNLDTNQFRQKKNEIVSYHHYQDKHEIQSFEQKGAKLKLSNLFF